MARDRPKHGNPGWSGADVSLVQWLALTAPEVVRQRLNLDDTMMRALRRRQMSSPRMVIRAARAVGCAFNAWSSVCRKIREECEFAAAYR
ncbi:hypothetical protein [Candidatus Frankia alpina]|uniref:hypothetical protein n=1 Tax=Candidatus Frankia alpina TaxID=2699483 RepID=UPI0013CF7142|nr:hypothetical protein [Candidatus Frankia alpina]